MIRTNSAVGDKFGVKVGVDQGSVLSPLLFIIVLDNLSRKCRNSLSWEMLYANDLIIMTRSLEELEATYAAQKNCMESRGLRVNLRETEVMIKYVNQDPKFTSGKYPCGVCCKGVGFNSIFCNNCAH